MPRRRTTAWSVHVEPDLEFGRYELFAALARPRRQEADSLTFLPPPLAPPRPPALPLTCRNQRQSPPRCPVIQTTCVEQSPLSPPPSPPLSPPPSPPPPPPREGGHKAAQSPLLSLAVLTRARGERARCGRESRNVGLLPACPTLLLCGPRPAAPLSFA